MITWPLVVCIIFCTLIVAVLAFLTFVYIKEYRREEKAMKEFMKLREGNMESALMYMVAPPPKKMQEAPSPPKLNKDKKDIN